MEEFSRRFDSFNSHVLAGVFVQWIVVIQRHKDGCPHAHMVVVYSEPLGSVKAHWHPLKRRWFRRWTDDLKALHEKFRPEVMAGYGLGVANLLPIGDPEGAGRYVARYAARELGARRKEDKGARLVRFSQSWDRTVLGPFTWFDARARRANRRASELAKLFWGSFEAMEKDFAWSRSASWMPRARLACGWPEGKAPDIFDPPVPVPIASSHGSTWKWYLRRTLYCSADDYSTINVHAELSLEFYNGPRTALEAAWSYLDRERKNWEGEHRGDVSPQGA
jgi:hypothetical protein